MGVITYTLLAIAAAIASGFAYILWDYVYGDGVPAKDIPICQRSADAASNRSAAKGRSTSDIAVETMGRAHSNIREAEVTPAQKLPRVSRGLFSTCCSDDAEGSSAKAARSRRTPFTTRSSFGSVFLNTGDSDASKPVSSSSPVIEFTEVSLLDSYLLPTKPKPSRFTEVFVTPDSCDTSSPIRESMTTAGPTERKINPTLLERERQEALMNKILKKVCKYQLK